MDIAIIDVVFIGVLIVFTLQCGAQGFVSELMSIAALIFGLIAAIFFFRKGGVVVRERFMLETDVLPEIVAFVMLFLLVFAIIKLLEMIFRKIIQGIQLSAMDRFLGVLFGLAEGVIVICLLLFLINIQPFFDPALLLKSSLFAELLLPFLVGSKWEELLDSVSRMRPPGGIFFHV
jgi:membrane protein required for colicin V production